MNIQKKRFDWFGEILWYLPYKILQIINACLILHNLPISKRDIWEVDYVTCKFFMANADVANIADVVEKARRGTTGNEIWKQIVRVPLHIFNVWKYIRFDSLKH